MNQFNSKRRARGAVLIMSLVMLLVLTILGIGAMQSATMEERMAGNLRDEDLAFQTSEAALREAQRLVMDRPDLFRAPDQVQERGLYVRAMLEGEFVETALMPNAFDDDSWTSSAIEIGTSPVGIAGFINMDELDDWSARFRVEQQPFFDASKGMNGEARDEDPSLSASFRVQSRSRGGSGVADAILEAQIQR